MKHVHMPWFCSRAPNQKIWQLISAAIAAAPEGWIIVDGQKTDGIESVAKQITRLVSGVESLF